MVLSLTGTPVAKATGVAAPAVKSTSLFSSLKSSAGAAATAAAAAAAAAAQKIKNATTIAAADATFGKGTGSLITATGGVSSVMTFVNNFIAGVKSFFSTWFIYLFNFNDPNTTWKGHLLGWSPFIAVALGILIWQAIVNHWFDPVSDKGLSTTAVNNSESAGAILAAKTANAPRPVSTNPVVSAPTNLGNTTTSISPDEYTLVGLQPRAIKQLGFIGPLPNGSFDTASGVAQTLRAGIRFLILQVDYLDTARDSNNFPAPGIPTLLYRGDDGSLISNNSADIQEVSQMIANLAFRPEVPNYTEPIIIYLHILRAPSQTRNADKYINFLSAIATALNPLAPQHLNMTPLGTFTRQKQEAILINTPLSAFEGQVIVFCNADTTVFRTTKTKFDPADDLDYWVNVRVYLNSSDDRIGVSQVPAIGVVPSAIVVKLAPLLTLSSEMSDSFAFKAKSLFVIAMPPQLNNPNPDELDLALNTLGINVIPLDIFTDNIQNVKELVGEYSNMTFRPKPASLTNA